MKILAALALFVLGASAHADPLYYGMRCIRNSSPLDQLLLEGAKSGVNHMHLSFVPDVFNRSSLRSIGVTVQENDRIEIDLAVSEEHEKNPDDHSRSIDFVFSEDSSLAILNATTQHGFDVPLFLGIAKTYPASTGKQEFFVELVTAVNSAQTIVLEFDPSECVDF